jgi:hypothetical protein
MRNFTQLIAYNRQLLKRHIEGARFDFSNFIGNHHPLKEQLSVNSTDSFLLPIKEFSLH